MSIENILSEFITACLETNYLGEPPEFSKDNLVFNSPFLKGELLKYYQHITLTSECYFGNEYFCLALLPFSSKRTTSEHWALQDFSQFYNQEYIIFACTDIDDILFCDMKDEKCPVYGGSPGDPDFYKLSNSLAEFLQLYTALTRLQLKNEFKNDFEFRNSAISLVERYISPLEQDSCKKFIFH